ncbi:MAG: hypothetical protein EHM72_17585, partial [Calditrichaeota bacterium]
MKSNIKTLLVLFCIGTACTSRDQTSTLTNDFHGVIIADSKGIYINDDIFSPDQLYPKKKWQGDWIGLNKDQYDQHQETHTAWINNYKAGKSVRALFRKAFDVKELPPAAILCITADVSFRAYVNGYFICQGPANIGSDYDDHNPPEHWFFSTHDVKKYLQIGRNTIAVEVYTFDLALAETTSGKAKFICDLDVDLNRTLLYTDTSWKCHLDTCLTKINEDLIYNAMLEIPDWKSNHFKDDHWPLASLQDADKDGYLIQSQIPATIRHPLKAIETWQNFPQKEMNRHECSLFGQIFYDESCTFDFGRNMSAYYTISLMAQQGDTVKIYPREKSTVNRALVYICREGKNIFTTPQLNVFRYLTVQVASREGLKIDSLYALYSSYPTRYAGSFVCSDSFYTQLWDVIRWTTQMCMNTLYLDSPRHQEPIACTGDYLIESLSNYYAFGDPWLARQDLIKTARMLKKNGYDMFHTSYSVLWVQMLYNYFQYTGDNALIKELLPHINKLNDLFATYLDENYLLSQAPDYMFMDWIKIDKFNAHHPPAVIGMGYLTAFYYQSLILASNFNQMHGDADKSR